MAARKKTGPRHRWTVDFGPGTDAHSYATIKGAVDYAEKQLRGWLSRAKRYAHDTEQDIEDAITNLHAVREYEHYAHFEPWEMTTLIDRHTNMHLTVRINRITKEG